MGGPRFAGGEWHRGARAWNGGPGAWHAGNWHGHDHFAHDHFHDHFHNRFVAVGIGGWWPGYYDYGYGYDGCGWLYRRAVITEPVLVGPLQLLHLLLLGHGTHQPSSNGRAASCDGWIRQVICGQ